MNDKNCLSYWFPLLRDSGLPVPKTVVSTTDIYLYELLDGKIPKGWEAFLTGLRGAGEWVGYPLFLRTGWGSGKHHWESTCYVKDEASLPHHVYALVEWSECAGPLGLPYHVWAVREMLPTNPVLTLPNYKNMPLCREFRCFTRDGRLLCLHPYWPWKAVLEGFSHPIPNSCVRKYGGVDITGHRQLPDNLEQIWSELCNISEHEHNEVGQLAQSAGKAVGSGYWSVDILETSRGWFITDMAVGEESYHWPGCPTLEEDTKSL